MHHQHVGILGGMGPAAGLYFAQQLIALNALARTDADHVPFILYSNPQIPSRVDSFLKQTVSPVPQLITSLHKLKQLGADFGVIVCNTAHIHFDEIADNVPLPLINMVDTVAAHAGALGLGGQKVGLLATTATVKSGLYARYFERMGIELVVPPDEDQMLVSSAIFGTESGIKATGLTPTETARRSLAAVADGLRRRSGVRHLILGCTELSFTIPTAVWENFQIIDPVTVLARTCLARTRASAPRMHAMMECA